MDASYLVIYPYLFMRVDASCKKRMCECVAIYCESPNPGQQDEWSEKQKK